ncbi:uncharacterized protein LOC115226508 [Octopus sinensis]|uniref:Uncharacterized protein LOC115226508 n=1 Tax=Octopus sinensis TaxID=2607531 RepID=A0A7E6FTV4_9MOLL|nr:uncharacterized protein LOC115226508 [Octopus sinensis]
MFLMMDSKHIAVCLILISLPSVIGTLFSFGNSGAQKCSVFTDKFGYVPGESLTYNYKTETTTKVNGFSKDDVKIFFESKVTITALSKCEFVMSMSEIALNYKENLLEEGNIDETLFQQPVHFSFHNEEIKTLWEPDPDPKSHPNPLDMEQVMNIKKGVLSLFQNSLDSFHRSKSLIETDVLGKCLTHYEVDPFSDSFSYLVTKKKDLDNCEERQHYINTVHSVNYGDDTVDTQPSLTKISYLCKQSFSKKSNTLTSATCSERHVFGPFSHDVNGAYSSQVQTLQYMFTHKTDIARFPDRSTTVTDLLFRYHTGHSNIDNKDIRNILSIMQMLCLKYSDDVRPEFPEILEGLVSAMRQVDASGLMNTHEIISNQDFCQAKTNHVRQYFLDAVPMVQTLESVKFIVQMIYSQQIGETDAMLWLTAISLIFQPSKEMVAACKPLLHMKDVPQNMALALSSLIWNYCRTIGDACQQDPTVGTFLQQQGALIVGDGDGADTACTYHPGEKTTDVLMALRAIGNLGYFQKILAHVARCFTRRDNPSEIRVAAIESMRRTRCGTTIPGLNEVFFDDTEDSELRIQAYIIMMRCPSHKFLLAVHNILLKEKSNQVGSYIWSHLNNLAETAGPYLQEIRTILEDVMLKKEFDLDGRKFSHYYEKSLYSTTLDVGAKLDSNVIFSSKSFIPRSTNLNLTMHLFGRAVNFLEVGGRAQAVDQILENFFGPMGFFSDPLTSSTKTIKLSEGKKNMKSKPTDREKFLVSFYIRVFGNEIHYSDDFSFDKASKLLEYLLTPEHFKVTRSFSLLDTETVLPTCSGLPLHLKITSTGSLDCMDRNSCSFLHFQQPFLYSTQKQFCQHAVVFLYISKLLQLEALDCMDRNSCSFLHFQAALKPSVSLRTTGQMFVKAFKFRAGVQITGTAHSSVGARVAMSNEELTIDLTKKKMEIFNFRSDMYLIHGARTKLLTADMEIDDNNINSKKKNKICSSEQVLAMTGLRLCQEVNIPSVFLLRRGPFIPLTGPLVYDLHLIKEDMPEGVLITIIPFDNSNILTVDTPESKQQRTVFIMATTKEEYLTVDVVSPWRDVNMKVVPIKNEKYEKVGVRILLNDDNKLYTASVWTKTQQWVNGSLSMTQLDVTRPDHTWSVKTVITQIPGKKVQVDVSSEGFKTRNMVLTLSKSIVIDAISIMGTLKIGPDTYTLQGGLDQPWKKTGFKHVSYLKVTDPQKTVLDFSAGISNEPGKRFLVDVKLDKVYSKLVSFYGLITFNAVAKQSKNLLRISVKSPLGILRLNGDYQIQNLETHNQMIFYYNFGPEYIDRLKIVIDTKKKALRNSSFYFGRLQFSSKKKAELALTTQGQLIISSSDGWQIEAKTKYGVPKDNHFINFQSLYNSTATNSTRTMRYSVSLHTASKQLEFTADTSYISGSFSFSRKFRNSLTVTTAQGNALNTSLSFADEETKHFRSLAFAVQFSTRNHEILFSEEFTQQKRIPTKLTNHLQVQWQKGQRLTLYTTFQNYSGIVYRLSNKIHTFSGRTANFSSTFLNTKDHYKATLQLNADRGLFLKKKISYFVESSLSYKTNPEGPSWELVLNQTESTNQNLLFVAVFSVGKQNKQSFQLIFRNSTDPYDKTNFDISGKHFWLNGKYHSIWSFSSTFRRMEQNLTFDPDGIELMYAASSNLVLYKNGLSSFVLNFTSPKTPKNTVSKLTAELHGVHTADVSMQFSKTDNGYDSKGKLNFNVLDSKGHARVDLSYSDFNRLTSSGIFYWHPPIHKTNIMNHALLATLMRNSSYKIVYNKKDGIQTGSSYVEISGVKPVIIKTSLYLTDAKDIANISLRAENGNNPYLSEVALNFYYKINDRSLTSMGFLKILPYFNTSHLEISLVKGRVSEAIIKLTTPYESLRSLQLMVSYATEFKVSKTITGSLKHNENELMGLNLNQYFLNSNDFGFTLYADAYNRRHERISLNLKYIVKYDDLLLNLGFKMAPRISLSSFLKKWSTKQFQYSLKLRLNDEVYKAGISISDKTANSKAVDISLATSNIKVVVVWLFNNDNKEVSRVTYQIAYDGIFFVLSGSYLNQLGEERVNIHMKIFHLIYRLFIINSKEPGKSKKLDFEIQNHSPINSEMKTCNFGEWSKIHIVLNSNTGLKDRQNISAMFSINSTCTQHFIVFYEFSELNEYENRKSVHVTCPDHGLSGTVVVDSSYMPVLKTDIHLSLDTRPHTTKGIEPLREHHHRSDNLVDSIKQQSSETNILFVTAEWISNQGIRVKGDFTKQKQSVYFHQNSTATTLFLYFDDINTNMTNNKAKRSGLISGQKSSDRFAVSLKNAYLKLIQIHLPDKSSLFIWVKIPQASPRAMTLSQDIKMLIGEMRLDFGDVLKIMLKFTTPSRTIQASGTFENKQRNPQSFDATVIYYGENNSKKFLLKLNGENSSKMKRLGISVLFPQSKNQVKLKVRLSGRERNILMSGKAVFTLSREKDGPMTLVFHSKLFETNGKYRLAVLSENLYTDMFIKLESFITLAPGIYDLELYSSHVTQRKEMTRLKNLKMYWSEKKFLFQILSPKKEISLTASVDAEGTYQIMVRRLKKEPLREDLLMEGTFDTAACSFNMKLMHDPDNVTNMYNMMINFTKSGVLFMDNINTGPFSSSSSNEALFELRPGDILYGEMIWKPNFIKDISNYFSQALKTCHKEFQSTGQQSIRNIAMSFWDIVKPINQAIHTEAKPLIPYIKAEFENAHREYSIYSKILVDHYNNNYLYVKSFQNAMWKVYDYLKGGLYGQLLQYRSRVWFEMVKIWEICQQIFQYLYDQYKMTSTYMSKTLTHHLHRNHSHYIELVMAAVNYVKQNFYINDITHYVKHEFGPKLTKFFMDAFELVFENGIQIMEYVTDRLVSILAQARDYFQSYIELPIINALFDITKEIYYETISACSDISLKESIRKSVSTKLSSMRDTLTNFSMTPNIIIQKSGHIVFEVKYYVFTIPSNIVQFGRDFSSQVRERAVGIYRRARNLLGSELTFWDLYYEMKPSADVANWFPPFKAHAVLFGGQHITTFDRLHYEIKARCSVVLSRDVVNGTFTVIANYQFDTPDRQPSSVTVVTDHDEHVEILQNQKVKVGGIEVNLPMTLTRGIVFRTQEAVTLESSRGYQVTLNFETNLVVVEISGWYFNKVAGLFGTYNNEPHDDFNLVTQEERALELKAGPGADLGSSGNLETFAMSWTVSENCKSLLPLQINQNMIITPDKKYDVTINDGDDKWNGDGCAHLFLQESSQFRNCFKQVTPGYFYKMCTSDVPVDTLRTSSAAGTPSKDNLCAVSSLYIRECQKQGVPLTMPMECLFCLTSNETKVQQGDSVSLNPVPAPYSADIIIVLQETKCNSETGSKLPQIIGNLNFLLSLINFSNTKFGLVGFGGNYTAPVYTRTFYGQTMSDSLKVSDVLYEINYETDQREQPLDIMQALTRALHYPFRAGAMKAIILVTCSSCQDNNVVSFELKEALREQDVILHVLAEENFKSVGNISLEKAHIYGANQRNIYPIDTNKFANVSGHQIVPDDSCAQEAIHSQGSYFNTKKLNKVTTSRSFMQTFCAYIALSLKQNFCQNCQCVPRQEGYRGHFLCHRCPQLPHDIVEEIIIT